MNKTHKAVAYELCQCIFEGDMALMRRYIKAGVDIDIGDYDQRTALHVAAAEANLPAVTPCCVSAHISNNAVLVWLTCQMHVLAIKHIHCCCRFLELGSLNAGWQAVSLTCMTRTLDR